jgi:hypothetical protein
MEEQWLPIAGWEGYYSVSNLGRVKSEARVVYGKKKKTIKERIMKPYCHKGYNRTFLTKDKKTTPFFIHRLVHAAFIGPIPERKQVDHIDGNPLNNRSDNLRVLTPKENRIAAIERIKDVDLLPQYEGEPFAWKLSKAYNDGYDAGYEYAAKFYQELIELSSL